MSPQKDDMITRQALEQHMKEEDNQWILGNPMRISRTRSLNASIATSTGIWQRNADQRRKNEKPEHALNVTRKDILPETAKESK